MPDRIPPSLTSMSKVRKVVKNVLIDVRQDQFLLGAAQDGHGNQAYVRVLRLGFVRKGNPEEPWIQLGHGEHCQVGWRTESLVDKGETWRSVGVGCMEEWGKGVVKLGKGGQQPHSVG